MRHGWSRVTIAVPLFLGYIQYAIPRISSGDSEALKKAQASQQLYRQSLCTKSSYWLDVGKRWNVQYNVCSIPTKSPHRKSIAYSIRVMKHVLVICMTPCTCDSQVTIFHMYLTQFVCDRNHEWHDLILAVLKMVHTRKNGYHDGQNSTLRHLKINHDKKRRSL